MIIVSDKYIYDEDDLYYLRNGIAEFLIEGQEKKYSPNAAYTLLLNSEWGRGILQSDHYYIQKHLGAYDFIMAHKETKGKYKDKKPARYSNYVYFRLAELIITAYTDTNLTYETMFEKTDLDTFLKYTHQSIGDYNEKLIDIWLINGVPKDYLDGPK